LAEGGFVTSVTRAAAVPRGPWRATPKPRPAVFRSIGLIVILVTLSTGCSVIRASPTESVKTGTLAGVVTGPTGPVASASISVTPPDNSYHVGTTDAQGYFSIASIPAGPVIVTVKATGYQTYNGNAVIPENGTATENISLSQS